MGFEFSQASDALKKCNGDITKAANFLFSGEIIDNGEVESSEFLSGIFDNIDNENDEDDSVLVSGDYQINGGYGEYFHIKAVRYHSTIANGVRFLISFIQRSEEECKYNNQSTFLTTINESSTSTSSQLEVQLDVPDLFINSHFSTPSSASSSSLQQNNNNSSGTPDSNSPYLALSLTGGIPIEERGTSLSDKDQVAIMISHLELQPKVTTKSNDATNEYDFVLYSSHKYINPIFSKSTMRLMMRDAHHKNKTDMNITSTNNIINKEEQKQEEEEQEATGLMNNHHSHNNPKNETKQPKELPKEQPKEQAKEQAKENTCNNEMSTSNYETWNQMMDMGVDKDMALQALQNNHFDLSLAFDSIFGDVDTTMEDSVPVAPSTSTPLNYDRFWTCKLCDYSSSYLDTLCSNCNCPRI
mmetsp:Transcript_50343/g.64522  ORF Transcript_50343/g.64522 Transcript_50343/m.64522 type:complete len:414 (+) Transcript_50343:747-1988(+)